MGFIGRFLLVYCGPEIPIITKKIQAINFLSISMFMLLPETPVEFVSLYTIKLWKHICSLEMKVVHWYNSTVQQAKFQLNAELNAIALTRWREAVKQQQLLNSQIHQQGVLNHA